MFTGLIQGVGRLAARETHGADQRLAFAWGTLPHPDIALGESIAVNGCCLTVVAFDERGWSADLSVETLSLTTLGGLPPGTAVNFERALLPTERLGGHLVAGHVDAIVCGTRLTSKPVASTAFTVRLTPSTATEPFVAT